LHKTRKYVNWNALPVVGTAAAAGTAGCTYVKILSPGSVLQFS